MLGMKGNGREYLVFGWQPDYYMYTSAVYNPYLCAHVNTTCLTHPPFSRNLLKIKQWNDAEYTVKDVEIGMMRMPDTGIDTKVVTAVFIEHKGETAFESISCYTANR